MLKLQPTARGIYVASRQSIPGRVSMWRQLRSEGWPIISSWIDADPSSAADDLSRLWLGNQAEISESGGLIFYAEEGDFPLNGAMFEAGMAIAYGLPVYVVLPGVDLNKENWRPVGSWMAHPNVHLEPTVESALRRNFQMVAAA